MINIPNYGLRPEDLKVGAKYNFRYQHDKLIYLGKKGAWHQFKKIGDPRPVWAEIPTDDLYMIEETI